MATWSEFGVIRSLGPSPVYEEYSLVPVLDGPFGDPEEQRDMVRLVDCDRQVGKPVLIEIRDSQVHRILAGGTGPRYLEAAVALAGQHEDALAVGDQEVQPPVPRS